MKNLCTWGGAWILMINTVYKLSFNTFENKLIEIQVKHQPADGQKYCENCIYSVNSSVKCLLEEQIIVTSSQEHNFIYH